MLSSFCLSSQIFIGASCGTTGNKFVDFNKDDNYIAEYKLKNGKCFSAFFDVPHDTAMALRIGFQYDHNHACLDILNNAGNFSFYKNICYSFNRISIDFDYFSCLNKENRIQIKPFFGVNMSLVINTKSDGFGWNNIYQTQLDSSGNQIVVITTENWEKNEQHSKDMFPINFGINVGFEMMFPFTVKCDFIIQNKYNLFLTNLLKSDDLKFTSFLSGGINLGFRYEIGRN